MEMPSPFAQDNTHNHKRKELPTTYKSRYHVSGLMGNNVNKH